MLKPNYRTSAVLHLGIKQQSRTHSAVLEWGNLHPNVMVVLESPEPWSLGVVLEHWHVFSQICFRHSRELTWHVASPSAGV